MTQWIRYRMMQIFVWDGYSGTRNNINGVTDYDYNGSDVRISNDGTRIVTSSPTYKIQMEIKGLFMFII